MKTIKQLITSHLKRVIILSEAVLLVVVFLAQVKVTQHQMVETAMERFSQIRHFLAVNEIDLTEYDVPEAGNGYELSDILSNLSVYEDAELYVLNLETQMVLGSTSPENVGKTLSELGFDFARTQREKAGFHATVHNEDVF